MPTEFEFVILIWTCIAWASIIALWNQSIKWKIDKWLPWNARISCKKCGMHNLCRHMHTILKDHNKSVTGYELRFRCPILDKRPEDQ